MNDKARALIEKRKRVTKQLRVGYLDERCDWVGLDAVRAYLTEKAIRNLPSDELLRTWDDSTRKALEAEGYTVCNPTARNGWRRSLVASDAQKMSSLSTRRATTRTRQKRDLGQLENMAARGANRKMRALAASRLDTDAAADALLRAMDRQNQITDDMLVELVEKESEAR